MQTSICSISRLSGAPLIKNIIKLNAITPIIGKTSEEKLISLIITHMSFALIGKQELLSVNMMKGVNFKLLV
jgi:hypothetical protein